MQSHSEELLADFEYAAPYMLHSETEDLTRLQRVFMYFTNQVHSEITHSHNEESPVIRSAYQNLVAKMHPEAESLGGPWLKVLNKVNPVKLQEEVTMQEQVTQEVISKKEKLDKLMRSLYGETRGVLEGVEP